MSSPDERIEQRARTLFQRASQELDPAMAGRLRAARREALLARPAGPRTVRLLLPAGAFAVVALAALMVWQPHRGGGIDNARPPAAAASVNTDDNELPPDADSADPALYQNLDFYGWLAATDNTHAGRPKP